MDTDDLPPTQYLIMEVLAARARLGERVWPFPSRLAPAIRALAAAGLVTEMSGNVDKTVRAILTDAGRKLAMSATYRAPLEPVAERAFFDGGRVFRRRVIVVDDWTEVPRG